MQKEWFIALPILACLLGATDNPKLYRWTDKEGNIHYTDTLPPEALEQAREELNTQGMAIKHVERALTTEERAAQAAAAEAASTMAANNAEQAKRDAILTGSYVSEADLQRAYQERFDLLEQSVTAAHVGIHSQEKSLVELLAHAARLEREGKPVPVAINTSIIAARTQVTSQRDYLQKREAERLQLQTEYDNVLARYRKLHSPTP